MLMQGYLQFLLAAGNSKWHYIRLGWSINAPSEELQQYLCFWKAYRNPMVVTPLHGVEYKCNSLMQPKSKGARMSTSIV